MTQRIGRRALLAGALGWAGTAAAQDLAKISSPELPAQLVRRWLTHAGPQDGWAEREFSARGWTPAQAEERLGFPLAVHLGAEPNDRPLDPQRAEWLQHLFGPFWTARPFSGEDTVLFRRAFQFTEAFADCASYIAADAPHELYVNGRRVMSGERSGLVARMASCQALLKPGTNVLGLAVRPGSGINGVTIWTDLHQMFPVRGGQPMAWLCSRKGDPGWERPETPPKGWVPAQRVPFNPHFALPRSVDTDPIWYPEAPDSDGPTYFRLPLNLEGVPNFGSVEIVADNAWELWVNGELVGVEKRNLNPAQPRTIQVGRLLRYGANLVAVKAYNYGGPAALACLPRVKLTF